MPTEGPAAEAPWTVLKTLQWTVDYFKSSALDTPRIDAETLLSHVLDCQRIDLYLRYDQPLNEDELTRFKHLIKRRIRREPVAYLVGAKEFWSLRVEVNPAVLIPRPDTECMVENALKLLPKAAGEDPCTLLELGVGSGAVVIALAHERPDCHCWASDRSWPAISLARRNARRHDLDDRIRFFVSHWLDAVASPTAFFDMVLSNPPYIRHDAIDHLPDDIRLFEPVGALNGGPDGLCDIRTIMAQAHQCLKPGGELLMEIGFDQRHAVEALARTCQAYADVQFFKDYSGHDRVVRLRKKQRP